MKRILYIQPYAGNKVYLDKSITVSQSFHIDKNNLSSIRVSVANPNLGGKESFLLTIEDSSRAPVRTLTVTESNLGWNEELRFDFAPIPDSAGKTYFFTMGPPLEEKEIALSPLYSYDLETITGKKFEATSAGSVDKQIDSHVGVAYEKKDVYKDGSAYLNSQKAQGDLKFELYYTVSPAQFAKDSLSDFTKRLSQNPQFLIVYSIIIVSVIFAILLHSQKLKNKQN